MSLCCGPACDGVAGQPLAPSNSTRSMALHGSPSCRTPPRHLPFFRTTFVSGCWLPQPMRPVFRYAISFKVTLTRKPCYSEPADSGSRCSARCTGFLFVRRSFRVKNTQVPLPLPLPLRRPLRRPDELGSAERGCRSPPLTIRGSTAARPSPAVLK